MRPNPFAPAALQQSNSFGAPPGGGRGRGYPPRQTGAAPQPAPGPCASTPPPRQTTRTCHAWLAADHAAPGHVPLGSRPALGVERGPSARQSSSRRSSFDQHRIDRVGLACRPRPGSRLDPGPSRRRPRRSAWNELEAAIQRVSKNVDSKRLDSAMRHSTISSACSCGIFVANNN